MTTDLECAAQVAWEYARGIRAPSGRSLQQGDDIAEAIRALSTEVPDTAEDEPQEPPDGWPMSPHLRAWMGYAHALRARLERMEGALHKLISYNEDIAAGLINYRPQDHIFVARQALAKEGKE